MTDYKELIKNLKKEDFESNRVNLHIHSTYSDGSGDFNDLIKQAGEKNYHYIAISDHNTINGYLDNEIPDYVIPAVEFDVWCGYVFMHLLGYGVDVHNKELQSFCAKNKRETELDIIRIFASRNIKKLINAIHNAG
ncbi:TPA: PHP domain-containing protein, partial [Candidatus Scatousia excrementigallinarum]|nr:PHP domain-containing protein [Candidatus Scatousia excrementigallinarum]